MGALIGLLSLLNTHLARFIQFDHQQKQIHSNCLFEEGTWLTRIATIPYSDVTDITVLTVPQSKGPAVTYINILTPHQRLIANFSQQYPLPDELLVITDRLAYLVQEKPPRAPYSSLAMAASRSTPWLAYVFVGICVIFIVTGMISLWSTLWIRTTWPRAEGTILKANYQVVNQRKARDFYVADMAYQYNVNGQRFLGTRFRPVTFSTTSRREIRSQLEPYRRHLTEHTPVTVYYHSHDPQESCLDASYSPWAILFLITGVMFLSVVIAWLIEPTTDQYST